MVHKSRLLCFLARDLKNDSARTLVLEHCIDNDDDSCHTLYTLPMRSNTFYTALIFFQISQFLNKGSAYFRKAMLAQPLEAYCNNILNDALIGESLPYTSLEGMVQPVSCHSTSHPSFDFLYKEKLLSKSAFVVYPAKTNGKCHDAKYTREQTQATPVYGQCCSIVFWFWGGFRRQGFQYLLWQWLLTGVLWQCSVWLLMFFPRYISYHSTLFD